MRSGWPAWRAFTSIQPIAAAALGGQLIRAFLVWAAERGAQRATVTAYAANDGARRLYARHGFAVRSVTLDLDDLPRIAAASG